MRRKVHVKTQRGAGEADTGEPGKTVLSRIDSKMLGLGPCMMKKPPAHSRHRSHPRLLTFSVQGSAKDQNLQLGVPQTKLMYPTQTMTSADPADSTCQAFTFLPMKVIAFINVN